MNTATLPATTGERRGLDRDAWRIALALAVWLAATAWLRPLMLPDEGRYVGVAWEMLRSGDWLTPTLDGLPFFHKPPLFYWVTAAALWLFGLHEGAARAAPLLGGWLGAFALYLFLRRWADLPRARLALFVLAVQPLQLVGAQFANLDMLVAGCISATVLSLAHAALCLQAGLPHRRALAAACALAALGVLAKGLIGVVIPALVVAAWLLVLRQWRTLWRLLWWPGLVVLAALAAPWFWAMETRHPGFLHYFFVVQHFQRFAAGGFNNVEPFWFYPVALAACSLAWLPWLAGLNWRLPAWRGAGPAADPVRALMAVWVATVVLFFSLPASKLVGYVLPAVPPLAVLMADGAAQVVRRWPQRRRFMAVSAVLSALVGVAIVIYLTLFPVRSGRELASALRAGLAAGEPVVALVAYPYDLPFYARLQAPIVVVNDWADPALAGHDDWRKELADAARFAPERAAQVLLQPAALPALLCSGPSTWVITAAAGDVRLPMLVAAQRRYLGHETALWQLRRDDPGVAQALGCDVSRTAKPAPRAAS